MGHEYKIRQLYGELVLPKGQCWNPPFFTWPITSITRSSIPQNGQETGYFFRNRSGYGLRQWEQALYIVTPPPIGWAHAQNDPWFLISIWPISPFAFCYIASNGCWVDFPIALAATNVQSAMCIYVWLTRQARYGACCPVGHSVEYRPDSLSLTHRGRDKMATISQTTFSNAFSWMKLYKFWLRFYWILFEMVQLTIFQYWFR